MNYSYIYQKFEEMEVFGIILLFAFVLMAFWALIFLFSTVGGWVALGAREMFVKKWGHMLGMKRNYPDPDEPADNA